jgi:hypothetical protein
LGTQIFTITTAGSDGVNTVRHNYQYQVTIQQKGCLAMEVKGCSTKIDCGLAKPLKLSFICFGL